MSLKIGTILRYGLSLNSIDGEKDIFVGKQLTYAFKNNENIIKTNYLYQFPTSLQLKDTFTKVFNPIQVFPHTKGASTVQVNFVNIDVLRVANIDIGDGTWGCEFYLDIVTTRNFE